MHNNLTTHYVLGRIYLQFLNRIIANISVNRDDLTKTFWNLP